MSKAKIYNLDELRERREELVRAQEEFEASTWQSVDRVDHIVNKVLQLANGIKRDVSRMLRLEQQWNGENKRVQELILNCRARIFDRCRDIAYIRRKEELNDEKWYLIVEESLKKVHKHWQSEEFQKNLETLVSTHFHDTTPEGSKFIREYVRIVWGIDIFDAMKPIKIHNTQ